MFPVEVPLYDEERLAETLESMRTWLDHKRFEPASFRYRFGTGQILFQVEFAIEAQASAFAEAFEGRLVDLGKRMAI